MNVLVEAPPSYDTSTSKQWLTQIGPFLTAPDLCNAARVCKQWNNILSPHLWGSPAKHFAIKPDDALTCFIQFRRCLSFARIDTRCLVHTLSLPGSMIGLDYNAHPKWLLHVFQLMPCLQSIVFPAVSFLDHSTLASLHYPELQTASYGLKLLTITQGHNVTSQGLLNLMHQLNGLIYIDLSGTRAARQSSVLDTLASFPSLKVLKLVDLALGDDAAGVLFQSIRKQVICLDVSNNHLTDKAMQVLRSLCLDDSFHPERPPDDYSSRRSEIVPASCSQFALNTFNLLTSGVLPTVSSFEKGLQYLDISQNGISGAAVIQLVETGMLRGLDASSCIASTYERNSPFMDTKLRKSQLEYLAVPYQLVLRSAMEPATQPQQKNMQRYLRTRLDSLEEVEAERQRHAQSFHGDYLSPILHPRLRILKLLTVPPSSQSSILSQSLIELISDCAFEQRLALLQTRLDYRLPPGQTTTKHQVEKQAKQLFALEEIALDIAPQQSIEEAKWSGWNHASSTKSVTGDADSQALWDAAASDFSFFGNEPVTPRSSQLHPSEKQQQQQAGTGQTRAYIDTVAEVSAFRKRTREAFDSATKSGDLMPKIDGFWNGKITIMRAL